MLLGFKKRFAEPIQIGTKVFTLRTERKVMPKIGERMYMYCALRTAQCFKISDKEKLISIQKVRLHMWGISNFVEIKIRVDGRYLSGTEIEQFVQYDGFKDRLDFAAYWFKESGKRLKTGMMKAGGTFFMFHWTDLKY